MSDAAKQIRLAIRALRTAQTHLRAAADRGCMAERTRGVLKAEVTFLHYTCEGLKRNGEDADEYLARKRARR